MRKISGETSIMTSHLSEILAHNLVKQYDRGIYYIQQTLHIIRVVSSPMKIPTSLTIFYQDHQDMSFYVNKLLYNWMGWLEDNDNEQFESDFNLEAQIPSSAAVGAAAAPYEHVLKFITKPDFYEYLNGRDFHNTSSGRKVNFNHPNNFYNILRTLAHFYSSNKYEVVIVDVGGKVSGIDPDGPHRSVKQARRILSLETNHDLELKVVYQTVIDYNADVLILSNLDRESRENFVARLKQNFASVYNRMMVFHE